jgi:glycosyltransferase 2 family protein
LTAARRRLALAAQLLLTAAVVWFAGRTVARQWNDVRRLVLDAHPSWPALALSGVLVLATYALLIDVWRATLRSWGARLAFWEAAHVWTVSNLGKYVPGKVWQIGAMGMMAQRRGVSPVAAVGSALLLTVVNVLAGFAVVFATGSRVLEVADVDRRLVTLAAVATGVLGVSLIAAPALLPRIGVLAGRLLRRPVELPALPARAVWLAIVGNVSAWLLYGLAFRVFTVAMTGAATGGWAGYTAVFTGSYLVGYLVLFAPAGIVFREAAMIAGLTKLGLATLPQATLLALTSRLWLTVLEIAPGALFLARAGSRHALSNRPNDGSP